MYHADQDWIGCKLPNSATVLDITWFRNHGDIKEGVVLCALADSLHPFATWNIQFRISDGAVDTYSGHYHATAGKAVQDYKIRGGNPYDGPTPQMPYHIWHRGEPLTYLVFGPFSDGTFDVEVHWGHVSDNRLESTYVTTVTELQRDTHIVKDLFNTAEEVVGALSNLPD